MLGIIIVCNNNMANGRRQHELHRVNDINVIEEEQMSCLYIYRPLSLTLSVSQLARLSSWLLLFVDVWLCNSFALGKNVPHLQHTFN